PSTGEYLAMIRRTIENSIRQALADTPVVLLNGARQTGKTTLAQAIAERTGAQFFTLDDAATLALAAGDPAGFIRNLSGPVVLDEIQKAPGLLNLADVGRDASLPHTTLTRFLSLLETVFLVHRLAPWSPNLGKRLV